MNRGEVRKVLQEMSYGLYIVGSPKSDGGHTAMLANWITQVSFVPPLIAVAVEHGSTMHEAIRSGRAFSVNILASGSSEIVRSFLKSPTATASAFSGWAFRVSPHGTPFLRDAQSCFECVVRGSADWGDHTLFVGEVSGTETHGDGPTLALRDTGLKYWKDP
jgi:flavin reductase (DIM6/NTAB) family NADH-FMN oxidoreductase RutF